MLNPSIEAIRVYSLYEIKNDLSNLNGSGPTAKRLGKKGKHHVSRGLNWHARG